VIERDIKLPINRNKIITVPGDAVVASPL